MAIKLARSVTVGDRIRFSVALIQDFARRPDHESPVLVLSEIRLDEDGTKILVLDRLPS